MEAEHLVLGIKRKYFATFHQGLYYISVGFHTILVLPHRLNLIWVAGNTGVFELKLNTTYGALNRFLSCNVKLFQSCLTSLMVHSMHFTMSICYIQRMEHHQYNHLQKEGCYQDIYTADLAQGVTP